MNATLAIVYRNRVAPRFTWTLLALWAAAAGAVWSPAAAAQPAESPPANLPTTDAQTRGAAWKLAQLAEHLALRAAADARASAWAYRFARHAADLAPPESELTRLAILAAVQSGQVNAAAQALPAYLRARPDDESAQWLLVTILAGREQTAERQAEVYLRIADGPRADRLSPAVRSRAAMAAFDLLRESAQPSRARAALRRAVELDPAHIRAARQALAWIARESPTPSDVADAMLNVLSADPFDPLIRFEIGHLALDGASHALALTWFESALARWPRIDTPLDPDSSQLLSDWALASLGSGRSRDAADLLIAFNDRLAGAAANAGPEGQSPSTALPPLLHALLIALLDDAGRTADADKHFEALIRQLDAARPQPGSPGESDWLVDRLQIPLLLGRGVDALGPLIQRLGEMTGGQDPLHDRLAGLLALRRGQSDQARALLAPLAAADPVAAYGLTLIRLSGLPPGEQGRVLQEAFETNHRGFTGAMIARRIRAHGDVPRPPGELRSLAAALTRVPAALRDFPADPAASLELKAQVIDGHPWSPPLPLVLQLTLTNRSTIPLAFDPAGAFSGRVVLIGQLTASGEPINDPAAIQTVQTQRRFRLDPGQQIALRVSPDVTSLLAALDPAVAAPTGLRLYGGLSDSGSAGVPLLASVRKAGGGAPTPPDTHTGRIIALAELVLSAADPAPLRNSIEQAAASDNPILKDLAALIAQYEQTQNNRQLDAP